MRKLKCVLVDDDPMFQQIMKDMCEDSPVVEITRGFRDPREFLDKMKGIDFDFCLLDIYMPELEGTAVAQMIGDKPVIFVTGTDKLKEALDLSPIDVITKPVRKDRLDKAFSKAYSLINEKKEFALFNVAESKTKVKIKLADIYVVSAADHDSRNKTTILKDGSKYTLMDYSFESILELSVKFVQINKSEIISLEAIDKVDGSTLYFKHIPKRKPMLSTVTDAYHKNFFNKLYSHL
jgi:DNA-binding LytR/AlgR family response regulator